MRVALLLIAWSFAGVAVAQEPGQEVDQDYEVLKKYYRHVANGYQFSLEPNGKKKLKLEKPALTWTGLDYTKASRLSGAVSGEVYIWTYGGRPIVLGGVGSFPYSGARGRNIFLEFLAITEPRPAPIRIQNPGKTEWAPKGIKMKPVPGADAPMKGDSKVAFVRRLVQMRDLAKQFSSETKSRSGEVSRLKLNSAPLYRLDSKQLAASKSNVIDGALFVFTNQLGTDPEAIILIECHKTNDELEWRYSTGTFTFQNVWIKHKDVEVNFIPNRGPDITYSNATVDTDFFNSWGELSVSLDQIKSRLRD